MFHGRFLIVCGKILVKWLPEMCLWRFLRQHQTSAGPRSHIGCFQLHFVFTFHKILKGISRVNNFGPKPPSSASENSSFDSSIFDPNGPINLCHQKLEKTFSFFSIRHVNKAKSFHFHTLKNLILSAATRINCFKMNVYSINSFLSLRKISELSFGLNPSSDVYLKLHTRAFRALLSGFLVPRTNSGSRIKKQRSRSAGNYQISRPGGLQSDYSIKIPFLESTAVVRKQPFRV